MGLLKASFSDGVYIPNSDFTSQGIKNWIPYKGSAVVVPINEIYTNPNFVSIKSTDLNPLIGSQSGVITKTSGNALGEGVYTEFFVDEGLRSQVLQISFYYKTLGDYNNHIKVYVYDTVNNIVIYPNMIDVFTSPSSSLHTALITLNINCGKYRLYFHVASSSTQAFQLQLNNIEIKKNEVLGGVAIGNTQRYVSTFSNIESVLTYRRVGSWLMGEVSLRQLSTTNILQAHLISSILPPGLSIDWSVFSSSISDDVIPLVAQFTRPGVNRWWGAANLRETNYTLQIEATGWVVSNTLNTLSPIAGDYVNIEFRAPIAQWTSNVNLASDFQEFAFNTQATINTNDTTSFGYGSGGTPILANTAATFYDVRFNKPILPTDMIIVELRSKQTGQWISLQNAGWPANAGSATFSLLASGFVPTGFAATGIAIVDVGTSNSVRVIFNALSSYLGTTNYSWANLTASPFGYDRWRVRKISNGNMAEVPPVVFTRVWNNNTSQSVPTPGAQTTVLHNTKEEDTHNAYNTSTGVWTCPVAGLYAIQTGVIWSYINAAAGSVKRLYIIKNGLLVAQDRNQTYSTTPVNALIQQTTRRTVRLSVGDTITSRVVDDTYGTSLLATTDSSYTYLELTRIGN